MKKFFYLILFMMILLAGAVSADEPAGVSIFELAPCFGDNMIFQQNEPIRIWGTSSDEGATVNGILGDSPKVLTKACGGVQMPCLLIRISAKKMFSRAILPCRAVANESHFFYF